MANYRKATNFGMDTPTGALRIQKHTDIRENGSFDCNEMRQRQL